MGGVQETIEANIVRHKGESVLKVMNVPELPADRMVRVKRLHRRALAARGNAA